MCIHHRKVRIIYVAKLILHFIVDIICDEVDKHGVSWKHLRQTVKFLQNANIHVCQTLLNQKTGH